MAYGIEVYNSNGGIQFSTQYVDGFTVLDTGTVSNTASVSYNATNEILGFNRTTTGWIDGNTNSTGTSWTNTSGVTINWLKLKRTSLQTEDSAGNYGIRVYDSTGTNVIYSSNFSKGQKIIDIIPSGSISSTGLAITQSPVIYSGSPSGIYYCPGRMVFNFNASTYQGYETTYFDYSTNVIRSRNLVGYNIGFGFIYLGYSNKSSIILTKRIP